MNIIKRIKLKRYIKKIQDRFDSLLELGVRDEGTAVITYSDFLSSIGQHLDIPYDVLVPYLTENYKLGVKPFAEKVTEMRKEVNKEIGYTFYTR